MTGAFGGVLLQVAFKDAEKKKISQKNQQNITGYRTLPFIQVWAEKFKSLARSSF